MEKEVFISYVKTMIMPLFTGSAIIGEEESSSRDNEVALGTGGTILIKPTKNDEYRLILKRNLAFKANEVELIRSIISEIQNVYNLGLLLDKNYLNRLKVTAIEKAICESISDVASDTLLNLITLLDGYATKTYEGRRMNFGIIINETQENTSQQKNLHYEEMFK